MAWARMALSVSGTMMRVPERTQAVEMRRDKLTVMLPGEESRCIAIFFSWQRLASSSKCVFACV